MAIVRWLLTKKDELSLIVIDVGDESSRGMEEDGKLRRKHSIVYLHLSAGTLFLPSLTCKLP